MPSDRTSAQPGNPDARADSHAAGETIGQRVLLWLLPAVFLMRVAAQAFQYWAPQAFLPDFSRFQGSSIGYPLLLTAQVLILALMGRVLWLSKAGGLLYTRRKARILQWAGAVYLAGSIVRIVIGLAVPGAPAWFTAWIPACLHVVLAAYVLTLASVYKRGSRPAPANRESGR